MVFPLTSSSRELNSLPELAPAAVLQGLPRYQRAVPSTSLDEHRYEKFIIPDKECQN